MHLAHPVNGLTRGGRRSNRKVERILILDKWINDLVTGCTNFEDTPQRASVGTSKNVEGKVPISGLRLLHQPGCEISKRVI